VSNTFETAARSLKARQLVEHLHSKGVTHKQFQELHPQMRAHHALMAGVSAASDETWALTGQMLESRERSAASQPADPFEGL